MPTDYLDTVVVRVQNLCTDLEILEVEAVVFLCDLKSKYVVPTFYGTSEASQFARKCTKQKLFFMEFLRFCEETHSKRKERNELKSVTQAEEDMTLDMSVEEVTNDDEPEETDEQPEQSTSEPMMVTDEQPKPVLRGDKNMWEQSFSQFVQRVGNKGDDSSGEKSQQVDTEYKSKQVETDYNKKEVETDYRSKELDTEKSQQVDTTHTKNLADSEKTLVSSDNVTVKSEVTFEDSELYGKLPGYSENSSVDQNLTAEIKTEPKDPDDVSLVNNEYTDCLDTVLENTNIGNSLLSPPFSVSMAASQKSVENEKHDGVIFKYAANTMCGSKVPTANAATVPPIGTTKSIVAGATNSQNVVMIIPFSATITHKKSVVPPHSSSPIPASSVPSICTHISHIPTNRGQVPSTQISQLNKTASPLNVHLQRTVGNYNLRGRQKRRDASTSPDSVAHLLKQQKVAHGDSSTEYRFLHKDSQIPPNVNTHSEITLQKLGSGTNTSGATSVRSKNKSGTVQNSESNETSSVTQKQGCIASGAMPSEAERKILRAAKRIDEDGIPGSPTAVTESAKGSNSTSWRLDAKQVTMIDHQYASNGQTLTSFEDSEQYGKLPGYSEQYGKLPGYNEQSGKLPAYNEQSGKLPGYCEQYGKLPGYNVQYGKLPGYSEQYGKLPGYSVNSSVDQNFAVEIKTEPKDPDDISLINNEYSDSLNNFNGKTSIGNNNLSSLSESVSMAANQQSAEHVKDDIKEEEEDEVDDDKLDIPTGRSKAACKDLPNTVSASLQDQDTDNCTYYLEVKKGISSENYENDKNNIPETCGDFIKREIDKNYGIIGDSTDGSKTAKKFVPDICSAPDVQESDKDYVPETDSDCPSKGIDERISGIRNTQDNEGSPERKRTRNSSSKCTDRVLRRRKKETNTSILANKNSKSIYVSGCTKKPDGKRIWDRKHFCLYCSKEFSNLTCHLRERHSKELEVQKALALKKNSRQRKEAWRKLMCKGDYAHNIKVMEEGSGEIIVCKRPSKEMKGTSYVQCQHCLGTYLSSELSRHTKKFHPETKQEIQAKGHCRVARVSAIPVTDIVTQRFKENILVKLASDGMSMTAQCDADIVLYGKQKFSKSAGKGEHLGHIRQKMRDLARFLQSARKEDPSIVTLRDCITPEKFEAAAKAVKDLCCFEEKTQKFGFPSFAKSLINALLQVTLNIQTDAIAKGDRILQDKAECFSNFFRSKWGFYHKGFPLETAEVKNQNKPVMLRLVEDLKALLSYLKKRAQEIMNSSEISQTDYKDLSQVTLTQLILFNKTRSEEAQRLMVQQYLDRVQNDNTIQSEVLDSLSPLEKKLAEVMNRVEVRGIKGKRVAILIPQDVKKQMDILIQSRLISGVLRFNLYMFPGGGATPLRAHNVLMDLAVTCKANEPDSLTSVEFEKHVATISQVLYLKDNGLDVLATFLWQDISTYKDLYHLPEDNVQVAKVSKLLLEIEKGNIHLFAGKTIDDIPLDEEHSKLEQPEPTDSLKEWSDTAVRTLIEVRTKNHLKLKEMSGKKYILWQIVSSEMAAKNFNFSVTQCQKQWRKMTRTYRDCINQNGKPGNNKKECPFDAELQEYYKYKPDEGTEVTDLNKKDSSDALVMSDAVSDSSSTCSCDSIGDP